MLRFLIKRLISLIITLFAVSIVAFAIIQLPPGDFLTSYLTNLAADGETASQEVVDRLRENYGSINPFTSSTPNGWAISSQEAILGSRSSGTVPSSKWSGVA